MKQSWSWEFLTEVVGLDQNRLYPSVYEDDDEAFDIWNKRSEFRRRVFSVSARKITSGSTVQVLVVRVLRFTMTVEKKYGCGKPGCTVGCDCDRYMEVWNNVFTSSTMTDTATTQTLIQKNIDTGMGLERLAVVVQDVDSIFDVDTFRHSATRYVRWQEWNMRRMRQDVSIRLITDHIRS